MGGRDDDDLLTEDRRYEEMGVRDGLIAVDMAGEERDLILM